MAGGKDVPANWRRAIVMHMIGLPRNCSARMMWAVGQADCPGEYGDFVLPGISNELVSSSPSTTRNRGASTQSGTHYNAYGSIRQRSVSASFTLDTTRKAAL